MKKLIFFSKRQKTWNLLGVCKIIFEVKIVNCLFNLYCLKEIALETLSYVYILYEATGSYKMANVYHYVQWSLRVEILGVRIHEVRHF